MRHTLRLRRGTNDQREQYTPKSGEPIFITDAKQLRIGDGETPGGCLVIGSVLVLKHTDPLPYAGKPWKRWLLKKLGGCSDYGFAYYPSSDQLYQYDRDTDKWTAVLGEHRLTLAVPSDTMYKHGMNNLQLY